MIRKIRYGMTLAAVIGGLLLGAGCTLVPDSTTTVNAWQTLQPGVERRTMDVTVDGQRVGRAIVLRLDPAFVTFRVHYSPGAPLTLAEWWHRLSGPAAVINGAFFDEFNRATGLLVSEGQAFGQSYSGFGGMFQVDGGGVRVRSLVNDPYRGEALLHAVQGFPMLIEAGGVQASQGPGFDQRDQRTAVGQDRFGRILFIVIPSHNVSLAELQTWLARSDLELYIAVGLDGGSSSGVYVQAPEGATIYPAAGTGMLPSVIAAYPRQ